MYELMYLTKHDGGVVMIKGITVMALMAVFVVVGCARAEDDAAVPSTQGAKYETAIFAGGCFWCMESPFEKQAGVKDVVSGYTDGHTKNPTYENYAQGGHVEVVRVVYDPAVVSYETLLDIFWRQINPTDPGGQFVDRGPQYRSAIFYLSDAQKAAAEKSKKELAASGRFTKPIVTEISKASTFYDAEDYHQDYYKKNPIRYHFYRGRSGRDDFLDEAWGKDRKK